MTENTNPTQEDLEEAIEEANLAYALWLEEDLEQED